MKKIFLLVIILCLLTIIFVPLLTKATTPLVPCTDGCTIENFFTMLNNVYTFIWKDLATPLAVVAIAIGGILMMISAGNPNLMSLGKKIFWSAVIGLALVLCSALIINTVLSIIGANTI